MKIKLTRKDGFSRMFQRWPDRLTEYLEWASPDTHDNLMFQFLKMTNETYFYKQIHASERGSAENRSLNEITRGYTITTTASSPRIMAAGVPDLAAYDMAFRAAWVDSGNSSGQSA